MIKILMSINPKYVERIFSGSKKYEFRKIKPKLKIDVIVVYATHPVCKIVGELIVDDVLVGSPEEIWKLTKDYSGVKEDFFEEYYNGKEKAIAYKIGECVKYKRPKKLDELRVSAAPQSFIYLYNNS